MNRSPKKTDKLEVRLSTETKQAFLARCRIEGRSASDVVRTFIDDHLARPLSPQELKMIVRSPFTLAGAAAAAVGAVLVLSAQPTQAQPDFAAILKSLDRDGDGRLSPAEFNGASTGDAAPSKPAGKITLQADFAETDTNEDGWISSAEFTAVGQGAILKRFLALDANSDGVLTLAELQRQGALLGSTAGLQPTSGMTISGPVQRLFDKLDQDRDGSITAQEFGVRP